MGQGRDIPPTISQEIYEALVAANSPSAANPYATMADIAAGWKPNSIPLGSLLNAGPSFFIDGGSSGVFLQFDSFSNDRTFYNDTLNNAGNTYDGSDLELILKWRISTNGSPGDAVQWRLEFLLAALGDDSAGSASVINELVDVSTFVSDELQQTVLGPMPGVANAEVIKMTLSRQALDVADTYGGSAEIISLEFGLP